MNYHNKKFRVISSSENGEVSSDMIFHYQQSDNILTCAYQGSTVVNGHLIGVVDQRGEIQMSYHQINLKGELQSGVCSSKPEIMDNGKIRLYESWQWTTGDESAGNSVLEEI